MSSVRSIDESVKASSRDGEDNSSITGSCARVRAGQAQAATGMHQAGRCLHCAPCLLTADPCKQRVRHGCHSGCEAQQPHALCTC